jgi:putative ABC transport system permease protein
MLRTTLARLRAHKLRLVATALAIVLGVGFVAGTLVFSDTVTAALYDQYARTAKNVDVAVVPPAPKSDKERHDPPALAAADLARVRAVPGVAAADGRMERNLPLLDRHGRLVSNLGRPGVALSVGTDPALRPYQVEKGRPPASDREVALDADTAATTGYRIGDTITVVDAGQRKHALTLTGLVGFGDSKAYADESVVVLTGTELAALTGGGSYQQIVARAAPGVAPDTLVQRVRQVIPAAEGASVVTGDQRRRDLATAAIQEVSQFLLVLQVFAWIAVLVAAFVIYNTFNILIAQRMRETALLRCVGASRRQVFGSVLLESAVVGLVGAALGLVLGLGVALGLFSGANAIVGTLPSHSLVLTATPVVVALLVGVVVTVLSAALPAVRATRVPPLAALRTVPAARVGSVRGRVLLVVAAVLVAGVAALLTVSGERASDNQVGTIEVMGGGILAFLAVLLVSPLFVGPLTALVGWLPGRLFGPPARLAVANARRNPGRAAATTAALMIGVGLMASGSVLTATAQRTATATMASHYPVDYLIQPADTGQDVTVPAAVPRRLRADRTFAGVAEIRLDAGGRVDGASAVLGAVDPSGLGTLFKVDLAQGSLKDLRAGTAVLGGGTPLAKGHHVGDRITVTGSSGRTEQVTVVGIGKGRMEAGQLLLSWDDLARLAPAGGDAEVLVKAGAGVSSERSRAALDRALAGYPLLRVGSIAQWRDEITGSVDQLMAVIAALLGFALLIALIGIMNTLSLSVFERTRESATARALGLTRGQLRATLLVEALLMALVGAVVGTGFGLAYGVLTTRVMFATIQPLLSVPVGQLLAFVAIAALAGTIAAVLPARRAARGSIVAAMAES